MSRPTPAQEVVKLLVLIERNRHNERDPRWREWVELMDDHLVTGPCKPPNLCPLCLVAAQPEPARVAS